jgi:hypothetical protein
VTSRQRAAAAPSRRSTVAEGTEGT